MTSWLSRAAVGLCLAVVSLPVVGAAQGSRELRALVGKTLPGRVTTVVDGDTVDVRLDTGATIRRTGFRALARSMGVLATCVSEAPEFGRRKRHRTAVGDGAVKGRAQ